MEPNCKNGREFRGSYFAIKYSISICVSFTPALGSAEVIVRTIPWIPANLPVPLVMTPTVVAVRGAGALDGNQRTSSKEPIAVLEHIHTVGNRGSIIVGIIGYAAGPRFCDLHPINHWRVVGIGAAELEKADLMAGDIAHINRVLLSVLRILRSNLEDKLLLLLRERIPCW
jgi:hypothetical protein